MQTKTLIVGYGITGKNLEKGIAPLHPDLSDIKQPSLFKKRKYDTYDIIFICVDTPYLNPDVPCDLSAVRSVIIDYKQHLADNGVFVIKSTVPTKTTTKLHYEFGDIIVYSPEYYGNTPHCNNFQFDFTILGGNPHNCIKVQQALQHCHDARHTFRITDSTTAELVKYMENAWLATKVSFCSQFYEMAEHLCVSYEELRELFILDPRVNPSHTFIDRQKPYWDTHCLNKDVRTIAETMDAQLLKSVIAFNDRMKATCSANSGSF
jgi:UDPglucose 6-dehydrogenase